MSELNAKDRLEETALEERLAAIPAWQLGADGDRLERTLVFSDFASAFSFMTHVAITAEVVNHHPEWSNVWNRVEIALTTHTAGGITAKDFALANAIDEIAARFELSCDISGNGECGGCR